MLQIKRCVPAFGSAGFVRTDVVTTLSKFLGSAWARVLAFPKLMKTALFA